MMKYVLTGLLILLTSLFTQGIAAQENTLRISYVKAPFNLQLMVMKEKGILDKHLAPLKLETKWIEITSGAKQAQALASGDLDIGGVMNTASILMANGEGNPVKIIAGVARPTEVYAIVAAKGGITSVSELKGKTIAGPKGTVLHQLLVAALAKEGMRITDVKFVNMDLPTAFAALQSNNIDAALLAANMVINAQKDGAIVLQTATQLISPLLVMTSSEKFFNSYPERIQAVVVAHNEAWQWIQEHPEEALALGAKEQGLSIEDAQKLYDWSHFTQKLNEGDISSMTQEMGFMLENGMMRNKIEVKPLIAPTAFE